MEFSSRSQTIRRIQETLGIHQDGISGSTTWAAIANKLSVSVESTTIQTIRNIQAKLAIKVDGVDGPMTWRAIVAAIVGEKVTTPVDVAISSFSQLMVDLARKEIGVEEIDGTNCGPRVNEYKSSVKGLSPTVGWPWCAAFICWLFREAAKTVSVAFKLPTTAAAWGFEQWARDQKTPAVSLKKPHEKDIICGDIVMFTFSHIGIAISSPDRNGYVKTIEGNTDAAGSREGGGVFLKKRHISKIRSRIRIK